MSPLASPSVARQDNSNDARRQTWTLGSVSIVHGMNSTKRWLAGGLLAAIAAGAFWYGSRGPAGTAEPAASAPAGSPRQAPAPAPGDAPSPQAQPPSVPSPAVAEASGDGAGSASAEAPDPERERVLDELASEIASIALERLGDPFIDYLVANGLPQADAEQIVATGFHASSRCSLEAMREQAQVESVPLDTVLYALQAELYQTDGPILARQIDLQAAAAREAPCSLGALQEAGIPPSVAGEIVREALSR